MKMRAAKTEDVETFPSIDRTIALESNSEYSDGQRDGGMGVVETVDSGPVLSITGPAAWAHFFA